jgi:membrane fusion protein, multidrug efflux system
LALFQPERLDYPVENEQSKPESPNKPVLSNEAEKATVKPTLTRRRWPILVAILVGTLLLFVGVSRLIHAFDTVSTDDAYVNGYVTFVAPRVSGQVARVLVDDNHRVKKGDVLVELDPEPYQVQVAIKQSAVRDQAVFCPSCRSRCFN